MNNVKKVKIKICGITNTGEAAYLNDAGVDYAGFVFHEKSKRNIEIAKAKEIFKELNQNIKKVAVMVSPDAAKVRKLQQAGFDILQVHGNLSEEALAEARLPVWAAVNITDRVLLEEKLKAFDKLPEELLEKVRGIVVDSAEYGSGKPFLWNEDMRWQSGIFSGRKFILAGGLNAGNVQDGIRIFSPDVVDVSSGVEECMEGYTGKSKNMIKEFTGKVKSYEQ